MKSENEIQSQLAYWAGIVTAYIQDLSQGRKVPTATSNKVTAARFRIEDLIWVLGEGKGGKASRKFSVSTAVLLELFGDADDGDGKTYREKYNASNDRNTRYVVRKKLLEEAQSDRDTSWEIL